MRFVYPEFLFALSAIAVPIIIHLFNFRRYKKVYFSNIQLLKEVKEQTQSRSRLKHLLVLFARILAITFLVFAFAQPIVPGSNSDSIRGGKIISVYIDNSYSMEAEGVNGKLVDFAKEKALEIADEYSSTDQFQLVTNNFEGIQQRLLSKEEFIEMVQDVQLSSSTRSLSEIVSRQLDVVNKAEEGAKRLIWISDFQKSTSDLENIQSKSLPKIICLPVNAQENSNLFIDSVWFDSPVHQLGAQEQVKVRIRNNGSAAVENSPLYLYINGNQKAVSNFTVEANNYSDSSLYFTNIETGVQQCEIKLSDAHMTFDDSYYFAYTVQEKVGVLSLYDESKNDTISSISRLFRNDKYFTLKSVKALQVDYASLPKNNLVILEDLNNISSGLSSELTRFVQSGGSVLFFPGYKSDINSLNNFLNENKAALIVSRDTSSVKTEAINYREPFFRGMFDKDPEKIDLPQVKLHYKTEKRVLNNKETLLQLKNGDDFLYRIQSGNGFIYCSTVPLDERSGNFSRHAIFVPVVLRIAEWSQNSGILFRTIGKNEAFDIPRIDLAPDKTIEIKNSTGDFSVIPEMRNNGGSVSLFVHGQIQEAGNYAAYYNQELIQGIGFNYDRKESDLSCYNDQELTAAFEKNGIKDFKIYESSNQEIPVSLEAIDDTQSYWKICLYLVLLFVLMEILLLRFIKN